MEEDYRLFQLVKRNPINNCVDLSESMRGKRNGFVYFTENFRIDFENRISKLGELEQENKKLESDLYEANNRIKDLLEESEE